LLWRISPNQTSKPQNPFEVLQFTHTHTITHPVGLLWTRD